MDSFCFRIHKIHRLNTSQFVAPHLKYTNVMYLLYISISLQVYYTWITFESLKFNSTVVDTATVVLDTYTEILFIFFWLLVVLFFSINWFCVRNKKGGFTYDSFETKYSCLTYHSHRCSEDFHQMIVLPLMYRSCCTLKWKIFTSESLNFDPGAADGTIMALACWAVGLRVFSIGTYTLMEYRVVISTPISKLISSLKELVNAFEAFDALDACTGVSTWLSDCVFLSEGVVLISKLDSHDDGVCWTFLFRCRILLYRERKLRPRSSRL